MPHERGRRGWYRLRVVRVQAEWCRGSGAEIEHWLERAQFKSMVGSGSVSKSYWTGEGGRLRQLASVMLVVQYNSNIWLVSVPVKTIQEETICDGCCV